MRIGVPAACSCGAWDPARFVYVVRDGRVRSVGVGTRAATRNRAVLRRNLRLARLR